MVAQVSFMTASYRLPFVAGLESLELYIIIFGAKECFENVSI